MKILKLLRHFLPKRWKFQVDAMTSIRPLGRDQFVYQEGDHRLFFVSEITNGEIARWTYQSSIRKWEPPHESEVLSDEAKHRILNKICQFFEMNNISHKVY